MSADNWASFAGRELPTNEVDSVIVGVVPALCQCKQTAILLGLCEGTKIVFAR